MSTNKHFQVEVVRQVIKENKADAFILISQINREWLTEHYSDYGFVIVTKDQTYVLVDGREAQIFKNVVNYGKVILLDKIDTYFNLIKSLKLNSILIEAEYLTVRQKTSFVDPLKIPNVIEYDSMNLRNVKTAKEIELMKKSAEIAAECMNHLRKWLKVGMTELEAVDEVYRYFGAHGASGESFFSNVVFGTNSDSPHGRPGPRKLKNGEFIRADIGCLYKRFCSDITRTWWVGKPTTEMLKIYNTVLEANKLAISKVKAGMIGKDVDAIARNYIKEKYHGYDIPHNVGHGVGREIHENPRPSRLYDKPLPANSIVTIEPGIYIENLGGVRVEDTILITKTGCEVLTKKAIK